MFVRCKTVAKIKSPNAPFEFCTLLLDEPQSEFAFSFTHTPLATVTALLQRIHKISCAPALEQFSLLEKLIDEKERMQTFDTSWFVSLSENPMLPGGEALKCSLITPLLDTPGCIMCTEER